MSNGQHQRTWATKAMLTVPAPASSALVVRGEASEDDARSTSLRDTASMMDALSYVETDEDQGVTALIEAEMSAMAREGVPDPEPWPLAPHKWSAMAQTELDRLDRSEDPAPLSIDRYNCDRPAVALEGDAQAWRKALHNCWAQLEHQANRVVNLELAESFADVAWARHCEDLARLKQQLEILADSKERECESINLQRKAYQEKLAPEIARLEAGRNALLGRHLECVRHPFGCFWSLQPAGSSAPMPSYEPNSPPSNATRIFRLSDILN